MVEKVINMGNHCNFCDKKEPDVKLLIKGIDACICEKCAMKAYNVAWWHLKKVKPTETRDGK